MTGQDDAPSSQEVVEAESLRWVNLLYSGVMTPEEGEDFKRWRAQSAAHEKAFADAIKLKRHVRDLILAERAEHAVSTPGFREAGRQQDSELASPGSSIRRLSSLNRRAFFGTSAAAAAVAIACIDPGHLWPTLSELTADYRTGTGERRKIPAANGVSVELNTQTTIDLQTASARPHLTLIAGEAAIAADRPRGAPFSVQAGSGSTIFERARLNIRMTSSSVCVTCVGGVATIQHPTGRVQLKAGEQTIYDDQKLAPPAKVDPIVATAWRRGLLIFRDAPLRDVVAELNRYRHGHIVLMSDALAQRPVYGVFEIARVEQAVVQVQRLTGAHATQVGGLVILT